jgi:hypothetical protein
MPIETFMTENPAEPKRAFISHSSPDDRYVQEMVQYLRKLGFSEVFNDSHTIELDEEFWPRIEQGIRECDAFVVVLSHASVKSYWVDREVQFARDNGKKVIPIRIDDCQLPASFDGRDVGELRQGRGERVKIAASRILRHSPAMLFGREKWLEALDAAWNDQHLNLYTLVAWGGVGKTSLVAHWVAQLMKRGWPGVERYFDWSFYSQGTGESRQTSADLFINEALTFFGDPDPTLGGPWERGERLATLIRQHRSLLVLDGIEPLQYPPTDRSGQAGRLKDPALEALIQSLAADNPGLCIITTREHLKNVETLPTTEEQKLDKLLKGAAIALLRHLQIAGTDEELEAAWRDAGGHALTLQLLGRFIVDAYPYDRDIRHYKQVHFAEADQERQGRSAFKVMIAYEKWFKASGTEQQRELAILRLTGLFDRPIPANCLEALRAEPAIPGLTDALVKLNDKQWNVALKRLIDIDLLSRSDSVDDMAIDAHPLVREYFAQQLQQDSLTAFCDAHSRLFEHLCKRTPYQPDDLAGLATLYQAVVHGCKASLYEPAWTEVYLPRILRSQKESYATRELGLFGEDLNALAGFFSSPWDKPALGLDESRQALLFALVGSRSRALGLLEQAVAPTERSIDMYKRQGDLESAAHKARHLAELHLARGELVLGRKAVEEGIRLADSSGNAYECYAERATLGAILHHLGEPAGAVFAEAEEILRDKANYPPLDRLYSLWGFRYCDWLLDEGKIDAAQDLGVWMQQMRLEGHTRQDPENGLGLISVGLEWLVLGRVGLLELASGKTVDVASIRSSLDNAVVELRRAGRADFIPLGHISRAAFRRLTGDIAGAWADLHAALAFIDRSGMMVHKVDFLLESARLNLATGQRDEAESDNREAETLIEKCGYGRRKR